MDATAYGHQHRGWACVAAMSPSIWCFSKKTRVMMSDLAGLSACVYVSYEMRRCWRSGPVALAPSGITSQFVLLGTTSLPFHLFGFFVGVICKVRSCSVSLLSYLYWSIGCIVNQDSNSLHDITMPLCRLQTDLYLR